MEAAGARPPKAPCQEKRGGDGNGVPKTQEMWELLKRTATLTAINAGEMQHLMGHLAVSGIVSEKHRGVQEGVEAGRDYQATMAEVAKPTPPSEQRGPPHLHILLGFLEGYIGEIEAKQELERSDEQVAKQQEAQEMCDMLRKYSDPEEAGEEVGLFRLARLRQDGARKIQFMTRNKRLHALLDWLAFKHYEAERKRGAAPRGNLERMILNKVNRKAKFNIQ